ncbi:MAG: QueT transporter family protein [Clostridia bacterium]|nr:QueT transporter family protein [Clostridia bacterium]
MNRLFTTKRLCRAGLIASLYTVLTYVFAPFAFGPIQIRPAEALCIFPLFYAEAVPALFIGCALSNLLSAYSVFDVLLGSAATLLAAISTYAVGRIFKKHTPRVILGGIFPVLFNAFIIPIIIVLIFGDIGNYTSVAAAYFLTAASITATQTVWVYALGAPLYFLLLKTQKKYPRFLG